MDLGRVLTRMARSTLNGLESVRLKTFTEMPEVPKIMARYGNFEKLDRVSLIAIKNITGFDGLLQIHYRFQGERVHLLIKYIDFRNGRIFRKRRLLQNIGASLFQTIESDLVEFATTIRRSYRVTLTIRSTPAKSKIYINGRYAGISPMVKELKGGYYTIELRKKKYKSYKQKFFLKNGDRLELKAVLYNPLASTFLNAPPGFRVESRQLHFGYRYHFMGFSKPQIFHAHMLNLTGLLRIKSFEVGFRLGNSITIDSQNKIDSFLGKGEGLQSYRFSFHQFMAVVNYALWEKYSFASIHLGGAAGFMLNSTESGNKSLLKWSFSADLYAQFISRLFRNGNFSAELQLDLGFAYLGQLTYTEKTFNIFGQAPDVEQSKPMFTPFAGITLRMVFWNDIF